MKEDHVDRQHDLPSREYPWSHVIRRHGLPSRDPDLKSRMSTIHSLQLHI